MSASCLVTVPQHRPAVVDSPDVTPIRTIRLFFQEGTSDKVYNATIYEDRGKYTVHVEWGRRGSRLQEGNKAVRVTRAEADRTFDRLVREKRGKGYEEITAAVQP